MDSVPFADCTLTIDGSVYNVSRYALANHSKLLRTIFEDPADASEAVQYAWNQARAVAGVSDLSFVKLLESLYTGLADASLLPRVLDYFGTEGLSTPCVMVTNGVLQTEVNLIPVHSLSPSEWDELKNATPMYYPQHRMMMDMSRQRYEALMNKSVGRRSLVLTKKPVHVQRMMELFDRSYHCVDTIRLRCREQGPPRAGEVIGVATHDAGPGEAVRLDPRY